MTQLKRFPRCEIVFHCAHTHTQRGCAGVKLRCVGEEAGCLCSLICRVSCAVSSLPKSFVAHRDITICRNLAGFGGIWPTVAAQQKTQFNSNSAYWFRFLAFFSLLFFWLIDAAGIRKLCAKVTRAARQLECRVPTTNRTANCSHNNNNNSKTNRNNNNCCTMNTSAMRMRHCRCFCRRGHRRHRLLPLSCPRWG